EIRVPYRRSGDVRELELDLRLQGCADAGLCYPPPDWTATVALPPAPPASLLTLGGTDEVLPPEQAFTMNARFDAPNELTVGWQIEPGYYLYRDKFAITADGGLDLGAPVLPAGEPIY